MTNANIDVLGTNEAVVQKLLSMAHKFAWAFAFLVALFAAFVYHSGYEEVAALVWLIALVMVLPIWNERL